MRKMVESLNHSKKNLYSNKTPISQDSEISYRKYINVLKTFWDHTSQKLVLFDKDLNIIDINKRALQRWKKSEDDIIGKNILDLFPPLKGTKRYQQFKDVIRTGKSKKFSKVPHPRLKNAYLDVYAFRAGKGLGMILAPMKNNHINKEELRRNQEIFRELSHYLTSLREEERNSIAREIHDQLAPILTALNMDFSWINSRLDEKGHGPDCPVKCRINKMQELTDETVDSLKNLCSRLRPVLLEDLGLIPAIEWELQEFRNRTKIKYSLDAEKTWDNLDKEKALHLFRIFQEALVNVIRHADASLIRVSLKRIQNTDMFEMKIKDNGIGITSEQASNSKSFGLIGMQERVHNINGKINIKGVPNRGTTITVTLPFDGTGQ